MLLLSWSQWMMLMGVAVLWTAAVTQAGVGKEREETGQWGEWGGWSRCTAVCSTGVTVRSRRCQHPHMLPVASLLSRGDDSVHCSGSDKEIMLCNTQACGEGRGGWRAEECAKHDASAHGGQHYTWEPFIHPSDPCKLLCRAKGHHFYSNLAARVVDGSPCAGPVTHPTAVCLQGQCQPVGCDDVVNSPWRTDACGVCKGDNSTCRKISGVFTRLDLMRGMNQIVLIPAGATRVRVKGLRYSSNWLALQNPESEDFVLNGGDKRSEAGQVETAGTVFFYKTKRRCAGQCLVAKGPTSHPLNLMLNTRGRNRGVMYSFNVPVNVRDSYFRRIISASGPRAEVIRNMTSAHQRATPNRPSPLSSQRPQPVGRHGSSNSMKNSGGSHSNDKLVGSPTRESAERASHPEEESDDSEDNDDEESDFSEENSDDAMEEDGAQANDYNSDASAKSAKEGEGGVTSVPGPASQSSASGDRRNITQREKPRFVDEQPSANKVISLESGSSAHQGGAGSDDEGGHSRDDLGRASVGSEAHRSVAEDVSSSAYAQLQAQGAGVDHAAPDVSHSVFDRQPEADAGNSGASGVLLQSDSPRRQRYPPYSARVPGSRAGGRRPWRRFRIPKYSQSFTFRHRQGKEDGDSGTPASGRSYPFRPAHVNRDPVSSGRKIRYRQQPQSQLGRPASVSAYGQDLSGSSYVQQRQYPSQRAGQSLSQGGSARLTLENNQRPQSGNVDFTTNANAQSSGQLDEYRRQLLRRRQLIEQQMAAQNADYQRILEEHNERLKQQHLAQQQRLQHPNDSDVSRPQPQQPQGRESQERQHPSEEGDPVQSAASRLPGGVQSPSEKTGGIEAPAGQPGGGASVDSQPTLPPSPVSGNLRPATISNRRESVIQERKPFAPSIGSSEEHRGNLENGESRAGGEQNGNVASSQRLGHSRPTPLSPAQSVADSLEAVDRQQPLIISNRRQSPQPEKSSSHSSPGASPGSSPSPPNNAGSGPSGARPEDADRRWPLFISNRRRGPGAPSGPVANSAPGAQSRDELPAGRAPGVRYGPSPVRGPSQSSDDRHSSSQTPEDRLGPSQSLGAYQISEDRYIPAHSLGASQIPEDRYRPPQIPEDRYRPPQIPEDRYRPPQIPEDRYIPSQDLGPSERSEDGYRSPEGLGPSQTPEPDAGSRGSQPLSPAGISPNLASLGGGFVAPQYIPDHTKVYSGRSDLSAPSSPNQLPSAGETPLVIGAQGNVIPNSAESEAVDGGDGGLLAIDKAEDMVVYEWRVSGLTECTLTCGGGLQQTVVVCLDTRTQAFVTENNCLHVPRPTSKALTCNTRPCPAQWQPAQWSACSVSCGAGEQTRLVACLARISPTLNVTMADENCHQSAEKPDTMRECQNAACNSWKVGNWSQCSAECGEGVRTRDVYCTDHTGYDVSDDLCSGSAGSKPVQEEVCVAGPCGKAWYYTDWPQECPTLCGAGTMERDVTCLGDGGAPLPDISCNMTSRPAEQQQCTSDRPCGGQWFTVEWTKCNVTCGSGYQEREVVCMKGMSEGLLSMEEEDNCAAEEKPTTLQSCEMEPCVPVWYMTSWSQCSQSCGTGHRTREVKCLDPMRRPSSQCPLVEKPVSREECNTASCVTTPAPVPTPADEECRDTFSRCQLVKHARLCRFDFYRKKCCATCTLDT